MSFLKKTKPTIFISIASYCDPLLSFTLDDCLSTAHYPENLRFGVCLQIDRNQPVDIGRFAADDRFSFAEFPYQESQGGSWARSIAQQFWDGETYTMQVDSHMVFATGWDTGLIGMMQKFPADKPLITMNSPLFRIDELGRTRRQTEAGIRTTNVTDWSERGGWAPWFGWGVHNRHNPGRSRFLSGGFSFTLGDWTDEVRQDPEHYYWGEEFALTLRSYTHGYDLFLPDEIVAWHMDHGANAPRRHWEHGEDVIRSRNKVALDRLRRLAFNGDNGGNEDLGRYGLGTQRSLSDYEIFAGMDLKNKRAHPDVYTGRNPDPVTIKTGADWKKCLSFDAFAKEKSRLVV